MKSLEEAVEWARRCADYMPSGEWVLEIRPIFEAEDFGNEFTPELRVQEQRLRAEIEAAEILTDRQAHASHSQSHRGGLAHRGRPAELVRAAKAQLVA